MRRRYLKSYLLESLQQEKYSVLHFLHLDHIWCWKKQILKNHLVFTHDTSSVIPLALTACLLKALCISVSHGSLTFPNGPLKKGRGRHIQQPAMLKVTAFPGLDSENCNLEIFQILPFELSEGNVKEIRFGTDRNIRLVG